MVQIVTDSSTLYTEEEGKALGIVPIPLCVTIGEKEIRDLSIPVEAFIADIDAGHIPVSSQPPIGDVLEVFERYKGSTIINLSMGDGLSGTYQTACSAREMAENREDITVVNTRTLCGPHRYMVECAAAMAREGQSKEAILQMVEEKMASTKSYLIPQDFAYLKRGGRLSPTAAWIGSLLNIKPILHVDDEGHLIPLEKVRGRRKALRALVDHMEASAQQPVAEQTVFITHGDCLEEAEFVADLVRERFGVRDIVINYVDPVIGAHSGPGTMALFFLADAR